jgi:hypothetical protein
MKPCVRWIGAVSRRIFYSENNISSLFSFYGTPSLPQWLLSLSPMLLTPSILKWEIFKVSKYCSHVNWHSYQKWNLLIRDVSSRLEFSNCKKILIFNNKHLSYFRNSNIALVVFCEKTIQICRLLILHSFIIPP